MGILDKIDITMDKIMKFVGLALFWLYLAMLIIPACLALFFGIDVMEGLTEMEVHRRMIDENGLGVFALIIMKYAEMTEVKVETTK